MKCKKLGCEKETKPGYEACSALHGADLYRYRNDIKNAFSSINKELRRYYSVEEVLHYTK